MTKPNPEPNNPDDCDVPMFCSFCKKLMGYRDISMGEPLYACVECKERGGNMESTK